MLRVLLGLGKLLGDLLGRLGLQRLLGMLLMMRALVKMDALLGPLPPVWIEGHEILGSLCESVSVVCDGVDETRQRVGPLWGDAVVGVVH